MSIIDAFDNYTEELLKAGDVPSAAGGPDREDFPKVVVMTFSPKTIRVIQDKYEPEVIGHLLAGNKVPIYRIHIPAESAPGRQVLGETAEPDTGVEPVQKPDLAAETIPVAVFQTGMGAPLAAAMMEELIARGAEKFVVFGSCGVLDTDLAEGHIIVPTEAYRDEGTSYHYQPPTDYIKIVGAPVVAQTMEEMGAPFVSGRIWTTDALYRETKGKIAKRREEGCIAVDMECAALQAVASFRGCSLYQFVYAEDSLGEEWLARNMGKVTHGEMEGHLELALAVVRKVMGQRG